MDETRSEAINAEEAARTPWYQRRGWRVWLYGVLVAAAPVAVLYGALTAEQGGLILVLCAALLGLGGGTALANYDKQR